MKKLGLALALLAVSCTTVDIDDTYTEYECGVLIGGGRDSKLDGTVKYWISVEYPDGIYGYDVTELYYSKAYIGQEVCGMNAWR